MKKLLLVSIVPIFTFCLNAQTLSNYYNVYPGMSYTYREILDISAIPNITTVGNNLTWDLSAIQLSTNIRTDSVLSVQQSLFPSEFASATFVLKEPNGLQQFFRNTNDTILYMGNSTNNTPSYLTPNVSIGNVEMPYNFDTNVQLTQNTTIGYSAQWAFRSSYKGYGTLLLPNGVSYSDVALLIGQAGEANGAVQYYSYGFMRASDRIPLVRIQLQSNGGPQFIQVAYVTESVNMSLEESTPQATIRMYPNPADKELNITNAFKKNIEIVNTNGVSVYRSYSSSEITTISVETLSTGIYFIHVSDNESVVIEKFVKQ